MKPNDSSLLRDALSRITQKLNDAGIASARLDALILLERATDKDRAWILAHQEEELSTQALLYLEESVKRRAAREPLAYILGSKEFYGLGFNVSSDVLIPRPETERMVEHAIENCPKNSSVLELGTGSGCIGISLSKHRPDLRILASDVSSKALSVAQRNNETHSTNVEFVRSDLFENITGHFDCILANLPYVPDETRHEPELDAEPKIALYAGIDGLDLYRTFFNNVSNYLSDTGQSVVEASPTQRSILIKLATNQRLSFDALSEYIFLINRT